MLGYQLLFLAGHILKRSSEDDNEPAVSKRRAVDEGAAVAYYLQLSMWPCKGCGLGVFWVWSNLFSTK